MTNKEWVDPVLKTLLGEYGIVDYDTVVCIIASFYTETTGILTPDDFNLGEILARRDLTAFEDYVRDFLETG